MRTFTPLGVVVLVTALLIVALLAAFVIGSIRYGGPDGLVRRVRAEVAVLRPHPQFVPTPLPTPTGRLTSPGSAVDVVPTVAQPTQSHSGLENSAESEPQLPPTPQPIPTPKPTSTPAAPPSPAHRPAAPAVQLAGFAHIWQKWNNCAPATLAMCLSQFGSTPKQEDLALVLKGNSDDKNVNPEEMADYVRSQRLNAMVRVNGDLGRLRLFVSNGIAVMVESWLEEEPGNGMGHYRLVTGYDDNTRQVTLFDSYVTAGVRSDRPYEGIRVGYDQMLNLWTVFNRTYILVYPDEKKPVVISILGADAEDATMWRSALAQAQSEVEQSRDDPFDWFNLGTDLVVLGRYDEAVKAYAKARVIGLPWRMLWYQFGPFRAYYKTGLYEELDALANATINSRGDVEEVYYWKGLGRAATGDMNEARKAWQKALELNPRYADAARALATTGQSRQEVSPTDRAPLEQMEDARGG